MASIVTIGYISQELSPGQLSTTDVDNILSALINNMTLESDLDILSHAVIAFLNFLIFARKNMEIEFERNVIFETIFKCLKHNNLDIRVYSMQCLVEISRIYYCFLESHIDQLISITQNHMLNDDERVSIQAYEFWCSISDDEVKLSAQNNPMCKYYCDRGLDTIFGTIKNHLMIRNAEKEKIEEDAWNNTRAASVLLANLCQCTNDVLIDYVFNMIGESIHSGNAKERDSTILAFGSVLETIHKGKIKSIIPEALPILLGMLKDTNSEVKCTVAWCLKKITEYHSDTLANESLFDLFVKTIIENLGTTKRAVVQLLDSLNFLVINTRPELVNFNNNPNSGFISKHMEALLPLLLQTAFSKDAYDPNNNIALGSLFTMGSLFDFAPVDTIHTINGFFNHLYSAFESTLSASNFGSDEIRYSYQAYIATCISACAAGQKVRITEQDAQAVYNLIKTSFEQRQSVYEEGIMACSSIALSLGNNFIQIIPDFGKFLTYALNSWQEVTLCRIAINSTSDLVRSMGETMSVYMEQITPIILDILEVIRFFINIF